MRWSTASYAQTRLSPLVVKQQVPSAYQQPSPPLNRFAAGDLVAGRRRASRPGRAPAPGHRAAGGRAGDQHLERAGGQVAPGGRAEPVEAAVGLVLGQVDDLAVRVAGRRLVLEPAHRRAAAPRPCRPAGRSRRRSPRLTSSQESQVPHGVAPPGAVAVGAGQDAVRRGDAAVGVEPDRRRAAAGGRSRSWRRRSSRVPSAKQAPPSGAPCQVYDVPGTVCPERAITRLVKPAGSWMPLASAAPSGAVRAGTGLGGGGQGGAGPETAGEGGGAAERRWRAGRNDGPSGTSGEQRSVSMKLPSQTSMEVNTKRVFPDDRVDLPARSGTLGRVTRSYRWFRQPARTPVTSP